MMIENIFYISCDFCKLVLMLSDNDISSLNNILNTWCEFNLLSQMFLTVQVPFISHKLGERKVENRTLIKKS